MAIESVMSSNHLILCCSFLFLPSIFPSIRVFSNESVVCIMWPNYWSFRFSISPSNEYSGWFHLGWTGVIPLQSKGLSRVFSNTTVQKHQFFGIQTSLQSNSHIHPRLLEKNIVLFRRTFVSKVTFLLSNILSRLVIAFLPRSKRLLISCLQSPSVVILECKKIKSVTVFNVSPSICHEEVGLDAMILVFWMLIFKPTLSLFSFTFIKRQKYRSMEQNRKPRDKSTQLWTPYHWQRTDAFELWCWRKLSRVPWTARGSNQSILKEINPE